MKIVSYGVSNIVLCNTDVDQKILYAKCEQQLASPKAMHSIYVNKTERMIPYADFMSLHMTVDDKVLIIVDMNKFNYHIDNKPRILNDFKYPDLFYLTPAANWVKDGFMTNNYSLDCIVFDLVIEPENMTNFEIMKSIITSLKPADDLYFVCNALQNSNNTYTNFIGYENRDSSIHITTDMDDIPGIDLIKNINKDYLHMQLCISLNHFSDVFPSSYPIEKDNSTNFEFYIANMKSICNKFLHTVMDDNEFINGLNL